MWIFSQAAYLSVVEDKTNPDMLLVRARVKGDIEKHFPDSMTTETPDADYLYRASIPRQEVATAIARIATDIDYSNFKNSVKDHRRAKFYAEVWAAMYKMQDELEGVTNPLFRPLKGRSHLFKGE